VEARFQTGAGMADALRSCIMGVPRPL